MNTTGSSPFERDFDALARTHTASGQPFTPAAFESLVHHGWAPGQYAEWTEWIDAHQQDLRMTVELLTAIDQRTVTRAHLAWLRSKPRLARLVLGTPRIRDRLNEDQRRYLETP